MGTYFNMSFFQKFYFVLLMNKNINYTYPHGICDFSIPVNMV